MEINYVLGREEYFSDMKVEMEIIIFCDYFWGRSKRKRESLWIVDNFLWWLIFRKFWYYFCFVIKWWFFRSGVLKIFIFGCYNVFLEVIYFLKGLGLLGSSFFFEDNGGFDCIRSDELFDIGCFFRKFFYEGRDLKCICFKFFIFFIEV